MTDPIDPREMRQRIKHAMHGSSRVDGKPLGRYSIPPAAAMIRNVLYSAEANGWSGEDAMTMLAYHALVGYEDLYDRVLSDALLSPTTRLVVAEADAETMRKRSPTEGRLER
jgi:hypothetical protein